MQHIDIREIYENQELINNNVTVCGWVRTARDSKNVAFIELNDGTSLKHLQIVVDKGTGIEYDAAVLKIGSSLKVEGKLVPSDRNLVEVNAEKITLLGASPADYPLQKKGCSREFLRTMPHLRLRTNLFNAVFRIRSVMAASIHEYFQGKNFVYVNPPLITASDCEGAGEMFRVTTLDYDAKFETMEEYGANDFFGKRAGLSVSAQLEGETAAMAMGKIYTFGPSFRAENSNTPKHLAEFWHVEPEVAFAELPDVMALAEEMVKYVIGAVLKKCPKEMAFLDNFVEKGLIDRLNKLISEDFGVVTYTEAIEILKKADVKFEYPVEWGCDLQTEHERYLSEKVFKKAVFVTNYPKEIKSFYMKQNDDGKTVAAVDLLAPGVGEIIGGSEREANMDKLLKAMTDRGMNLDLYSDYIDLRKFGSAPHGGFGLGFERLIMYVTGIENIRDVVLYPRTVNNIR